MRNKMSIKWHEDCLVNQKNYVKGLQEEMERAIAKYESALKNLNFYEYQIKTAKEQGRDGFDDEKFLKNK